MSGWLKEQLGNVSTEPIATAVRVVIRTKDPQVAAAAAHLGGLAGVVVIAAVAALMGRKSAKRSADNPAAFKLAPRMAIALSGRQLLFWSLVGLFREKPHELLGTIPMAVVDEVQFSMRRLKLSFWLAGGPTLEVDVPKKDADDAREFVALANAVAATS
jgi:hypothetical protein